VEAVWLWILVGGCVALLIAFTRLLSEYVTEAQSLQVTDSVAEILHAQSVAVDLATTKTLRTTTRSTARRERLRTVLHGLSRAWYRSPERLALAGIAAWLVTFNWLLAAVLFLAVLPGALARLGYSRRLYGLQQAQTEQERRSWYYHTVLTETLHARNSASSAWARSSGALPRRAARLA